MPDVIEIRGLRALGIIGLNPEELDRAQPFEIDFDVVADLTAAGTTDELDDTLDYGALVARAEAVVTGERHQLLERVAAAHRRDPAGRPQGPRGAGHGAQAAAPARQPRGDHGGDRPPLPELTVAGPAAAPPRHRAFLAMGSNLGDRAAILRRRGGRPGRDGRPEGRVGRVRDRPRRRARRPGPVPEPRRPAATPSARPASCSSSAGSWRGPPSGSAGCAGDPAPSTSTCCGWTASRWTSPTCRCPTPACSSGPSCWRPWRTWAADVVPGLAVHRGRPRRGAPRAARRPARLSAAIRGRHAGPPRAAGHRAGPGWGRPRPGRRPGRLAGGPRPGPGRRPRGGGPGRRPAGGRHPRCRAVAEVAAAWRSGAHHGGRPPSGALGLEALAPHPRRASLHPLVSMPSAEAGRRRPRGAWWAVAGDPARPARRRRRPRRAGGGGGRRPTGPPTTPPPASPRTTWWPCWVRSSGWRPRWAYRWRRSWPWCVACVDNVERARSPGRAHRSRGPGRLGHGGAPPRRPRPHRAPGLRRDGGAGRSAGPRAGCGS